MEIRIIRTPIPLSEIAKMAQDQFGDFIKAVVDIERRIMALGGELHSDEEALLLEDASRQENLWGINIYPQNPANERVEFDSMINVRPAQNNRSRNVEDSRIREQILKIVSEMVLS